MQKIDYISTHTLDECIERIMELPQQYECEWGTLLRYNAERISNTKVLITFTGGQFRKIMRTQYEMDFHSEEKHTLIHMHFIKELFNLPPLTPISDIDCFMKQKACASRVRNTM